MINVEKSNLLSKQINQSIEEFEVLADKLQRESSTRRDHSNGYLVITKAIEVMRNLVNLNEVYEAEIERLLEQELKARLECRESLNRLLELEDIEEEVDPITEAALGNIVCIKFKQSTCCDASNTPFIALVTRFENSSQSNYLIINDVTIDKQDIASFEIYIKS